MESIRFLVRNRADGVLEPAEALAFVNDPRFGGCNLFLGRVRESNHGRGVLGISYDLFQPLALARFGQIAAQIGRTVEATRQQLARIRLALRDCIQKQLAQP